MEIDNSFIAINRSKAFENPVYCFGITQAYAIGEKLYGDCFCLADVEILPNGSFEYRLIVELKPEENL